MLEMLFMTTSASEKSEKSNLRTAVIKDNFNSVSQIPLVLVVDDNEKNLIAISSFLTVLSFLLLQENKMHAVANAHSNAAR